MATSNDDVYKQIISIQHTLYDQHSQIREELDGLRAYIYSLKEDMDGKLSPVIEKVEKHDHTFHILSKVMTWVIPSGAAVVGFFCWIGGFFQHK